MAQSLKTAFLHGLCPYLIQLNEAQSSIRQTFAEDLSVKCGILRMESMVFPAPHTFADKVIVDVSIAFSDYSEVAKKPAIIILKCMTAIVKHIVRSVEEAYKP